MVGEWESAGDNEGEYESASDRPPPQPPNTPATLKEQLQLAHRNGLRLLKLVNTLLDFSRLEAGRVQACYEPTDLATFTAELASVFRSAIERANLQLTVDCLPLSEVVYVDREMWEKIIFNLLSNAFKFTFEGEILVRLQRLNHQVELTVQDTGIGIPATELPHLFERFHRVEGALGRSIEGSGIGLSLVQELVKLHHGTINVTSVEGVGTCFTILIPLGTAHLPPNQIEANRTLPSTVSGANSYLEEVLRWLPEADFRVPAIALGLDNKIAELASALQNQSVRSQHRNREDAESASRRSRILLADDNADMRDYIKRLLSQQYEVQTVADGAAALGATQQQVPDLVLTDVMMPKLDGFGLLQALRADPQTQEIPIIMLSARAGEEARIEGLAAGADDYLTKPFSAKELLARVEATLKLAQLRQEAAKSLQRSEERYRAFVQHSSEGIWRFEVDPPMAIAHSEAEQIQYFYQHAYLAECNEVVAQMYGVSSPDDLLGAKLDDFLVASDPRNLEYLKAFIRSDYRLTDSESYEFDQNGNPKVFLNNLIGIIEDGKLIRAWGTQRDITDRKRAELNSQFLSQLDQRLRQLSTSAAMVQETLKSLGEYLKIDRCLWDRIDWEAGVAIIEQDWCREDTVSIVGTYQISNFILPELFNLFRMGQSAVVEDVQTYPYTASCVDNFVPLNVRAFISIPCVHEGRLVRTLAVHSKTIRKWQPDEIMLLQEVVARLWSLIEHTRVLEALHKSETELRHLADAMPQIVWISKADGELEFINRRWLEYTGLTLEQSRDRAQISRLIPLEDNQQLERDFAHAQATRSPYQSQFRLQQTDGSLRYFLARATPIKDGQGNVRKWYGTSTDITELKQLEAERTQLLAKEQAARESAESANRIKDEFLAVLSHELRSPLNPILGWARLLQTGNLDAARTQQALSTIERNAKLQSELIEDLLDVSRILRGKLNLNVSSVDLATTVKAAVETVRLAAEAKSIHIEVQLNSAIGLVSGDTTRLQQVVWNLLSNAVKFTPAGGRVEVRLEQIESSDWQHTNEAADARSSFHPSPLPLIASQAHAQITVSDTGKGIDSNFLPHVFDYFRQADSATTRQFGGLGLGLAIVRHLVELHGGTIRADSPGDDLGATFTVRLPVAPMQQTVDQISQSAQPSLSSLKGIQILVVDDDSDTRNYIEFLLEQVEATVITAASAAEALAKLQQTRPDLLLSDIGMPEMDGYMLMRQVRSPPPEQGGNIPAIALTAYAGEVDQQHALAVGFQRHIAKPVDPEALIKVIAALL